MSLETNFCASPWFHMRINSAGHYEYCRWSGMTDIKNKNSQANIKDHSPIEFFQQHMAPIRRGLYNGELPLGCGECARMERHHKVSGRQKQLLKVGIKTDNFVKTAASSPWLDEFARSSADGVTDLLPQDWQIDLGNYCNSGCVFCMPDSSSRLATEFFKLKLIDQLPPAAWCDNPVLLDRFLDTLRQSSKTKYIHFIGGETLITPAFEKILQAMIDTGINQSVTIGFTTNLTVWDERIIEQLKQFETVNLGVSIECFHPVNDYVRWPSKISQVQVTLSRWLQIAQRHQWLVQFRTTPTILTIGNLLSVYDYAWDHGVAVESCNFLTNPPQLRPSVLPMALRQPIVDRMNQWIATHSQAHDTVINIRNPNFAQQQIVQDLQSYVNYLTNEPDESHRLSQTVSYLKLLESSRKNSILDYLPDYELIFRAAGY